MVFRSNSFSMLSLNRGMLLLLVVTAALGRLPAQDTDPNVPPVAKETGVAESDEGVEETKTEPDPFAVPKDADAQELFRFIQTVKRLRGRSLDEVKQAAVAAADAAQAMRELDELTTNLEIAAIREQLGCADVPVSIRAGTQRTAEGSS